MRRIALLAGIVVACVSASGVAASPFFFADLQESAAILGASDEFTEALSPLDRAVRARVSPPPEQAEFRKYLGSQARRWAQSQVALLTPILSEVSDRLSSLKVSLPPRIALVLASERFEEGAPHTRGTAIVIPQSALGAPRGVLRTVLFHETFHVLTRSSEPLRDELFALIGYIPCAGVPIPGDLSDRLITNPDAPRPLHAIRVSAHGAETFVVPLLVASSGANWRQPLFRVFEKRFLRVQRTDKRCLPFEGDPALLTPERISGFSEQVGRNSPDEIQPEEILADNFALLMSQNPNVPSPEIIAALHRVLLR